MDFKLTEEEEKLRQEVREFLKKEVTEEAAKEVESGMGFGPHTWELLRKIGARGWLTPSWPQEYGGLGASYMTRLIISEEIAYFGGPESLVGAGMAGPTILLYGNEEQKKEYLPQIARGEIEFALGYTEPHAGSDLAALEIRAVEDGDDYVMNGQKVFNTASHYAQYHWLGARTDPDAPKHRGISLFIVDLKSPGITVSPLWTVSDGRTNEVFYDNVRVPKKNLVGEKNRGFYHIATALDFERMHTFSHVLHLLEVFVQYLKETKRNGKPLSEDPILRQRIAELAIELEVSRLFAYRIAWILDQGTVPNYEPAMMKILYTELEQKLVYTWLNAMGHYGLLQEGSKEAPFNGRIEHFYRQYIRETILRGTSEVMKYIIAARGLGLPR